VNSVNFMSENQSGADTAADDDVSPFPSSLSSGAIWAKDASVDSAAAAAEPGVGDGSSPTGVAGGEAADRKGIAEWNGFAALLGTDGNELGVVSSGNARGGSKPSITASGTAVTLNTPEASVSASGWFSWPKSCWANVLCVLVCLAAASASGAAFACFSHGSNSLLASIVVPGVTALPPELPVRMAGWDKQVANASGDGRNLQTRSQRQQLDTRAPTRRSNTSRTLVPAAIRRAARLRKIMRARPAVQAAAPAPNRTTVQAAAPAPNRTTVQAAAPAPNRTTVQAAAPAPNRTTVQAAAPAPNRTTRGNGQVPDRVRRARERHARERQRLKAARERQRLKKAAAARKPPPKRAPVPKPPPKRARPAAHICGTMPRIVPKLHGDCAIVGSSDVLRLARMGKRIDAHDTIWRVNNAPTRGYETIVGARTDVRIINHVTVDVWMGTLRAKGEARRQRIDVGGNLSDVWGGGISPEEVAARASLPREGGRRTDEALPAEYDPKMCTGDEACFMLWRSPHLAT